MGYTGLPCHCRVTHHHAQVIGPGSGGCRDRGCLAQGQMQSEAACGRRWVLGSSAPSVLLHSCISGLRTEMTEPRHHCGGNETPCWGWGRTLGPGSLTRKQDGAGPSVARQHPPLRLLSCAARRSCPWEWRLQAELHWGGQDVGSQSREVRTGSGGQDRTMDGRDPKLGKVGENKRRQGGWQG